VPQLLKRVVRERAFADPEQVGETRDVPDNELLVLWSRSGFSRRASATLARSEEVFFVAPGLSTDASGRGRQPAPG